MSPALIVALVSIAFAAGVAWGRRGRGTGRVVVAGQSRGLPVAGYHFTEDTRRILTRARAEAGLLGNKFVGPEHILLGLIHVNAAVTARVLERLGVDLSRLHAEVLGIVSRAEPHDSPDLPYTSRAKRVLEHAMIAARDLDHDYVGAEHLLLALSQDAGAAGKTLVAAGASYDAIRAQVSSSPTSTSD